MQTPPGHIRIHQTTADGPDFGTYSHHLSDDVKELLRALHYNRAKALDWQRQPLGPATYQQRGMLAVQWDDLMHRLKATCNYPSRPMQHNSIIMDASGTDLTLYHIDAKSQTHVKRNDGKVYCTSGQQITEAIVLYTPQQP